MKNVILLTCLVLVKAVSGQANHDNAFVEKTISLSTGIKLSYVEKGSNSGTPVVLLHGYTDSWHSFEEVMKHLPASMHVFAITLRGHGNSDKPAGKYSAAVFAADVASFVRELNIGIAIIVGHSMGATIAQRFVLDYPHLTKGFVLAGGIASFPENEEVIEFSKTIQNLPDPVPFVFAEEFQKSTVVKPIDESRLSLYVNESMKVPSQVWKSIMAELISIDYTNELTSIKKPALVLWGEQDLIGRLSDQEKFLELIQGSRLIVYKGHGHGLHWEDPVRFANDIGRFVQRVEEGS